MYKKIATILVLVLMLALSALVSAQDIVPADDAEIDPNANISWPPPVYLLRGTVEIRGSANLPEMTSYFLEFRPLEVTTEAEQPADTEPEEEEAPWFPITLPNDQRVQDDVLGSWDTETTDDGLYEMRLTINIARQEPTHFVVRPLRVENELPPFVVQATPTTVPTQPSVPTEPPAPPPTQVDTTPRVTATVDSNVRSGDSTRYPRIGFLFEGETAPIVGRSSTGSGWYLIQLSDGDRGFIAPSIVQVSGDLSGVPFVDPPPLPTPTPTPTPATFGNLTGTAPSLNPATPTCNVSFQVLANITNTGSQRTSAPVTVVIQDIHTASGTVNASASVNVPQLDPGQNFVVSANFTVTAFYNEEHRVVVNIDTTDAVAESNETDNTLVSTYTLQKGACP